MSKIEQFIEFRKEESLRLMEELKTHPISPVNLMAVTIDFLLTMDVIADELARIATALERIEAYGVGNPQEPQPDATKDAGRPSYQYNAKGGKR